MTRTATPQPGYRPCVGVLLFDDTGRVFVAERRDAPGAWQMPQGGIDPGESPSDAALRELVEEIGTDAAEIIGESAGWISYDLPPDLAARMWDGRYRGQTQKWFAARFRGSDADIRLDGHGDAAEFHAWRWVAIDDVVRLIVGFKRTVYDEIVAELGPIVARTLTRG